MCIPWLTTVLLYWYSVIYECLICYLINTYHTCELLYCTSYITCASIINNVSPVSLFTNGGLFGSDRALSLRLLLCSKHGSVALQCALQWLLHEVRLVHRHLLETGTMMCTDVRRTGTLGFINTCRACQRPEAHDLCRIVHVTSTATALSGPWPHWVQLWSRWSCIQ